MQGEVERALKQFPEVEEVVARIGTAEVATDAMPPNISDTYVLLKDRSEWPDKTKLKSELLEEMEEVLEDVPGNAYEFSQPIELRFNEFGILLNGELIENEIRSMVVNQNVSEVSAISSVRRKLVEQQREMSRNKGVVMDGRDIGTVVFPEAELKLFMTAQMGIRVKRRKKQLAKKGIIEYEEAIEQNLAKRDEIDTTRSDSPLKQATDAIVIDTSDLTLNEQVKKIVNLANNLIYEN